VRGDLARYDLATGAPLGVLTSGGADAAPSVSPDGRSVAFDRDGAIWVVPAAGGRARRVVARGRSVAWGGGAIPPAVRRLALSVRGGRLTARPRVEPRARVVVEARPGARRVGRAAAVAPRTGAARVVVRLAGGVTGRLTVRVTVTPPGAAAERVTRTVRGR
jgi:hypothetical protein